MHSAFFIYFQELFTFDINRCAIFGNHVGVQSGGVRGYVGLRVGAGPGQPGERPGVQGAIGKHARGAVLGTDGQAKPPADHEPSSLDLRQGVRVTRAGGQIRAVAGK